MSLPSFAVDIPDPINAAQSPVALHRPEWMLPTGHGGFAMGCGDGGPGRRYHTLLNAAANPPVDRIATVGEPVIVVNGIDLRSAPLRVEKQGDRVHWLSKGDGWTVERELTVGFRTNTAALRMTVKRDGAAGPIALSLAVPVLLRDFHKLDAKISAADFEISPLTNGFHAARTIDNTTHRLRVRATGATFRTKPSVETGIAVPHELDRGDTTTEARFRPGVFEAQLAEGENALTIELLIAFGNDDLPTGLLDDRSRTQHLKTIAARFADDDLRALAAASDDFLVQRFVGGEACMSVIAGYPWFADWGRDTMIALPGLLLVTERYDEALSTLRTYARHVSQGMIPNRFDDYGGPPHYNTVDASLWFHHAAAEYLRSSGDESGYREELLPACLEIIAGYTKGTRFGIGVDKADGLVFAGDDTTQLTWMDAKRDGKVFTPRHGKAVEINALWFNALRSTAAAIRTVGSDATKADELDATAERVRESFNKAFLGGPGDGLIDCLRPSGKGGWEATDELRPNQLLAVSLPHSPLNEDAQRRVVQVCRQKLLTPMGMRTLSPDHPRYRPNFTGDMMSRDDAYHNGTVWPWLIGPMAEATLRVSGFSAEAKREARTMIEPLIATMRSGCLGQICEVSDADEPRLQQGCIAQAWSVAEVLRIGVLVRG
jgi:glycogen debranching enzyme